MCGAGHIREISRSAFQFYVNINCSKKNYLYPKKPTKTKQRKQSKDGWKWMCLKEQGKETYRLKILRSSCVSPHATASNHLVKSSRFSVFTVFLRAESTHSEPMRWVIREVSSGKMLPSLTNEFVVNADAGYFPDTFKHMKDALWMTSF